ncbi:MAG: tRNA (adenosine(37)-N6)-dimethylallyltransferase MiaA [Candidatus Marinimicrobia bacterium]|nr:tRNA (adenosine(37)-N6)-dimethylallyltransferase MiaA [Candidatus Neomarinimicrobiota bacterium]
MKDRLNPQIEKISPVIPLLTGPTAVGKTSTSIELAKILDGEIISIDSRQLYKFLDIGTAKPTLREQKSIPHHLIDLYDPTIQVSAGEYRKLAIDVVEKIVSRGKWPIFVGGSGMYIHAVVHGIFQESISDSLVREKLMNEIAEKGNVFLYNRLMDIDSEAAKKIHINDAKRIIRALEIYELTGETPTQHFQNQHQNPAFPAKIFVLTRERAQLYHRINQRVDQMLADGLVTETEKLLAQNYRSAMDALKTLGYQEVIQYLDHEVDYSTMVENLKMNTRRYAKRQLTWFRHKLEAEWIELQDNDDAGSIAKKIAKSLKNSIK